MSSPPFHGVRNVGAVSHVPFDDFPNWYSYYWPEGASKEQESTLMADHRSVSPGFFLRVRCTTDCRQAFQRNGRRKSIRAWRLWTTFSLSKTWPGKNPIGQKLNIEVISEGNFSRDWAEVVGVTRHVRYQSLTQAGRPQVYLNSPQSPRPQMQMAFALRADGPPESLLEPIKRVVAKLDKDPTDLQAAVAGKLRDGSADARAVCHIAFRVAGCDRFAAGLHWNLRASLLILWRRPRMRLECAWH